MGDDRLTQILDGTYTCLATYGVRRMTMDDIAGAVGISRSALYQYVSGKDDAVRRLVRRLHEQALERARAAAAVTDQSSAQRVRGVMEAKLTLVTQLRNESPHTGELLDEKARLFGDICHDFTTELRQLLADTFAEGPPLTVDPSRAADICVALVIGMESVPDAERDLDPAVAALTNGLMHDSARSQS